MPARTASATFDLDALKTAVPKIFDQAQATTANHQKNFVALYKLHTDAASRTESVQDGRSTKLVGERAFEDVCLCILARVLPHKKGTTVADRIVRFLGGYTKFVNEKGKKRPSILNTVTQFCIAAEEAKKEDVDDSDDTTASRFISRMLTFLLAGCVAKDKSVRFRVVQCISELITQLGEIE